jgi:hypothetical protein
MRPKQHKLGLAFRRALLALRKRLIEPKILIKYEEVEIEKEVIKEILVEKLIYQKVEIPTPYEITKYVGVPVPTDPKDLPRAPEISNTKINHLFGKGEAA